MERLRAGRLAGPALAALVLAACGAEEAERTAPTPAVEVVQARVGSLPLSQRLSGVVKAENQVSVRPEIEAVVAEVYVKSGEAVSKGQPLVRLRDTTFADQLRQAEAAVRLEQAAAREAAARVEELRAQVVRTRELAEQQLVSRMELDTQEAQVAGSRAAAEQAQARVQQAVATVEERRTAVARTIVRSPVAGRVGQRTVEPGMLANPATVLFVVGNLDRLRVEVPLTGEMLSFVKPGQGALVHADALGGEPLRARIARISPFLAEGSLSTTGEIDVTNHDGRLRPGMFVSVDLLHGETAPATLVPASALWEDPRTGQRGVFVVAVPQGGPGEVLSEAAHPVALRVVEVRAEGHGQVGVSGVEAGEWVVTVGQHLLALGADARARVRATSWERVQELQGLQREDLLRGFMEKQQRLARAQGAALPTAEHVRQAAQADATGASPAAPQGR
jgi:RND family efflux transporter MFP subunit